MAGPSGRGVLIGRPKPCPGVSRWHLPSLETCPPSKQTLPARAPVAVLVPELEGEQRGTDLLDVRDVRQPDDFVPLGGAGLGALEAQVAARGRGKTQHLDPGAASHGPPAQGDEKRPEKRAPLPVRCSGLLLS